MHIAKSIAVGILVLTLVALIDAGQEAFADAGRGEGGRVIPICTILDAFTPIYSLVAGVLATAIVWTGPKSGNRSGDLLSTLIAALVALASILGAIAIVRHFTYLNGPRPIPWYRFAMSGLLYFGMGWLIWHNLRNSEKQEGSSE
ncbi:MAG: hypothetical protein AAGA58_00825 [Verrucomicrobiota bacterium]